MTVRGLASLLLVIGCSGRSAPVLADRSGAADSQLTGAWDLTLTLDRPYAIGLSGPAARRVCGTIGFVDAVETGDGVVSRESDGVYHVALAQLGLAWLDDTKFPSAIARQRGFSDGTSAAKDSVAITLNPDSREHIELLGVYRGSEIAGDWSAQSARGTASGNFTLRPHTAGNDASASC